MQLVWDNHSGKMCVVLASALIVMTGIALVKLELIHKDLLRLFLVGKRREGVSEDMQKSLRVNQKSRPLPPLPRAEVYEEPDDLYSLMESGDLVGEKAPAAEPRVGGGSVPWDYLREIELPEEENIVVNFPDPGYAMFMRAPVN